MPTLFPPAKPRLDPVSRTDTVGQADLTYSAEPSVEPLSTRKICSGGCDCPKMELRQESSSDRPFQFTMTTAITPRRHASGHAGAQFRSSVCPDREPAAPSPGAA